MEMKSTMLVLRQSIFFNYMCVFVWRTEKMKMHFEPQWQWEPSS